MLYQKIVRYWNRQSRIRRVVMSLLLFATVFVTSYFLVLPAITVENTETSEVGIILEQEPPTVIEEIVETQAEETAQVVETSIVVEETSTSIETTEESVTTTTEDDGIQKDEMVLSDSKSDMLVYVTAPESAQLPVETKLEVKDVPNYEVSYYEAAINDRISEVGSIELVDISLISQQGEIEPSDTVKVEIHLPIGTPNDVIIVHFKDDGTVEELSWTDINTRQVNFNTDSFSVFAIVNKDNTRTPRYTYKFENIDGTAFEFINANGELSSTQILKNGESLFEVGLPKVLNNKTFKGWFSFDKATDQYGEQIKFTTPISIVEDKEIIVRPNFENTYYLTLYENEAGTIVYDKKTLVVNSNNQAIADVSKDTVPPPSTTKKFVGWSLSKNGPLVTPANEFVITKDTALYPVFSEAYKVEFFTGNAEGAPVVPTGYVLRGEAVSTIKPADPVWAGYKFDGWYYNGSLFNFNMRPTSDIRLEAKWSPAATTYNIVFWQQSVTDNKNASDAQKTYEYAGQISRNSVVGTTFNTESIKREFANQYSGFYINDDRTDKSVVVQPDGKSNINIYFNRHLITMQFNKTNFSAGSNSLNDWRWEDSRFTDTFTGLYGSSLQSNGYSWPNSRWRYYASSGNPGMSFLGDFILPPDVADVNDTSKYPSGTLIRLYRSGTSNMIMHFKKENLNGLYELVESAKLTAGQFQVTEKFDGYTATRFERYSKWTNSDPNFTGRVSAGTIISTNQFYDYGILYSRKSYYIHFLDPVNDSYLTGFTSLDSIKYEALLSTKKPGASIIPKPSREGYVWDGKWYKDKSLTQEFDWTVTMPSHDMKVYAGFRKLEYDVKVDLAGGELAVNNPLNYKVEYGNAANSQYNFSNISRNYVEDPNGTYYYVNGKYTQNTATPGIDLSKKYRLEQGIYDFIGWYQVLPNGTLTPFNFNQPVASNLSIRAAWRKAGIYHVVYSNQAADAQGQPLNVNGTRLTVSNQPVDSLQYDDLSMSVMGSEPTAPANYYFKGWYYDGKIYSPKDAFQLMSTLANAQREIIIYPVLDQNPINKTFLKFDANGGDFSPTFDAQTIVNSGGLVYQSAKTVEYPNLQINQSTHTLDHTIFEKPGYELIGWHHDKLKADNWIAEFDVNQEIGVDTRPDSSNTLYAVWKPIKYKVTIVKEVVGNADDLLKEFTFFPSETLHHETFKLSHLNEKEIWLDYGTEFSIFEQEDADFSTEKISHHTGLKPDNSDDQNLNDEEIIKVDGDVQIKFINSRKHQNVAIKKANSLNMQEALAGAVFNLYAADTNGQKTNTLLKSGLTSGTDGLLVDGDNKNIQLPIGVYYLTEQQAPAGYNLADSDAVITVRDTGVVMSYKGVENSAEYSDSKYTFTFTNNKGYELPATGGMGTNVYYVVGIMLMLFASLSWYFKTSKINKEK